MRILGAILLTAVMFAASPALAQRGRNGDLNGDGRLSQAEYVQASVETTFAYDADKNGSVTIPELPALARTPLGRKFVDRVWREMDTNRDGALARLEVDTVSRRNFARDDLDGDGFLSRAELDAARKAAQKRNRDGGGR